MLAYIQLWPELPAVDSLTHDEILFCCPAFTNSGDFAEAMALANRLLTALERAPLKYTRGMHTYYPLPVVLTRTTDQHYRITYRSYKQLHRDTTTHLLKTDHHPDSLHPPITTFRQGEQSLFGVPGNQFFMYYKQHILKRELEERDLLFWCDDRLAKWVVEDIPDASGLTAPP